VKHLDSITEEVDALIASDACGIIPDFKSEPGFLVIKAYIREAPSSLCAVYVGEALYQLRSVLDHLVCHLTENNGHVITNKTGFPIFLQRAEFRDTTGNHTPPVRRLIGGIPPEQQALIEAEQPFQSKFGRPEDDPLWWLYRLSNFDRHRFIHLVGSATLIAHDDFTPKWFADRYFSLLSTNFGAFEGETEVARYRIDPAANDVGPPPVLVQVHSHVSFGIAFDMHGPGEGKPVVTSLKAIGERVARLVAEFFVK
jgi:hypothetical protein